ncbi:meiotic recombination protein SPO11-1 isoform X2 [Tanacetum coccineum]
MYHSGSSSSTKAAADFEQGADSEPTFVETTGHCSSDSAPSTPVEMMGHASPLTPVEMMGHASSDSAPSTPVEMMGHASSDSAPSTPVEMMGHSSGDSAPSAPVEMKGHSSSDIADSASIEMKGNSFSDGDDSSSYESDFHDSEADNELEEDPGSMFDAEPGAELVEPELSEAESDVSTRIEIIWNNLSTLKGKFKMGEIPDDVLYGKEVDGQQLKSKILELFSEASVLKDGVHYFKFPWNKTVFDSTLGYYVKKKASKSRSATMLSRQSSLFVCLLSHILNLIQDGTKATPDEAKYWDETLYVKVEDVKAAVDAICMRFECVRSSEEAISEDFVSEAHFILIVEKDTVFHRLEINFCQRYRCIMVTAKGQPNVSTRMFVQSLRRNLQIPVFVLVDCNPSGFIIMSAYRHGAETRAFENHRMAVPDLK